MFLLADALRALLQRDVIINRAASAFADASYSLYLSHWFVLSGLGKLLGALQLPPGLDWAARLLGLTGAILFALASFRYAENPIDRLLRPRARRPDASAPPLLDWARLRSGYSVVPLEASVSAPNVVRLSQNGRRITNAHDRKNQFEE